MRIAAQVAMVVFGLVIVAALRNPLLFFGPVQIVGARPAWVIMWYVLFTLPRELVDRHAGQLGAFNEGSGARDARSSQHSPSAASAPGDPSNIYVKTSALGRL